MTAPPELGIVGTLQFDGVSGTVMAAAPGCRPKVALGATPDQSNGEVKS
jgi:hypothetical protein